MRRRPEGASRVLIAVVGLSALAIGFGTVSMITAAWPAHPWVPR